MYNENPEVAAAQKVMLEILIEIHKICEKHNITYWLEAGTLLGAVRHKGFIPWDDDCDISMPREDYNRFMEIAGNELPMGYILQNPINCPEMRVKFAKVRKEGTILLEEGETGKENYSCGVFVDIFPYDTYSYVWIPNLLQWLTKFRDMRSKYSRGSAKRLLATIFTNIIMAIPVHILLLLKDMYAKHIHKNKPNDRWYTFGMECGTYRSTKKDDILPVIYADQCFEGRSFYLPHNSKNVLKDIFGETYMELPSVEHRKTHAKYIEV